MRALLCREYGPASKLVLEDIDDPTPGKGEILVAMKAAGLNFPDTLIIENKYQFKPPLPFTPGGEGAGIIEAIGEGVSDRKVGERVIVWTVFGAFAEKLVVAANLTFPFPGDMDFETAAGFAITYGTSYHALKQRAELREGECLVVLGAAGGVGLAAVELGKAMGARVIACASTDEKLAVCKAAGADDLINYTNIDLKTEIKRLSGSGADVIYDPVGGDYSESAIRAMGVGGHHLVVGFAAGDIPKIPLNLTLLKQCQIVGVFWGAWATANPAAQAQNMLDIYEMFGDGRIKPRVDDRFVFSDYIAAFACLTERRAKGKVILTIES
jgi:NADPH:quinone reductase